MNDPTDLPFDRIPLNGPTATLPGGKSTLDELLAGSSLLPPTRSPLAVSPTPAPKVTPEPAETPKPTEATTPPPEPRWVKEAMVNLLAPSRKKVMVLSSAAALAAGAMAVNVMFSGRDHTPPTAPSQEETLVAAVQPTPTPEPQPTPTPDPTPAVSIPPLGVPVLPPVSTPIPTPTSPGGYQPTPLSVPVVIQPSAPVQPPSGVPMIPSIPNPAEVVHPTPGIVPAGAVEPIPPPAIPGLPNPTPQGATPNPMVPAAPMIPGLPPAVGIPNPMTPMASAPPGSDPGLPPPVSIPGLTPPGAPAIPGIPPTTGQTNNTTTGAPILKPVEVLPMGAAANLKFGSHDVPGSLMLTKPSEPSPRSNEPARTDFDVDLHEPKAGDTYATISKLHYGDAKYAEALRAFNRNAELGRTPVDVPPMYVLRKRYSQFIGRSSAGDAGRERPVDWSPSSK